MGVVTGVQEELQREVDLMAGFQHPNIVNFVTAFRAIGEVWVVMELCAFGSLKTVLSKAGPLTNAQAEAVCHPVLCGLRYLHHERHTIHR